MKYPIDPPPTQKEKNLFEQYRADWQSKRAGTIYGLLETRPRLETFVYNLRLREKKNP